MVWRDSCLRGNNKTIIIIIVIISLVAMPFVCTNSTRQQCRHFMIYMRIIFPLFYTSHHIILYSRNLKGNGPSSKWHAHTPRQ